MGFNICYVASKATPEEIVSAFDLTVSMETDEMPETALWLTTLNSDWTILWSEDEGFGQKKIDQIKSLSFAYNTYLCVVNETVMSSSCEFWSNGKSIWSVWHIGDGSDVSDKSVFNLSSSGSLPANFEQIKSQHIAKQETGDKKVDLIFEVPLELAKAEIGFRHEQYLRSGTDVEKFLIAEHFDANPPLGFFSRLFGKRST